MGASQKPPEEWSLRQPFGARAVALSLVACVLLGISAERTRIDDMLVMSSTYLGELVGLTSESQVGRGVRRFTSAAVPLAVSESTPTARIEGFDPDNLPWLSYLTTRETTVSSFDHDLGRMVQRTETEEVLVQPGGYVLFVLSKMLESIEIALWGTLLAILVGAPLAFFSASQYAPHHLVVFLARASTSFLRSMPELVVALFLVLAFGFGPIAGVLALGLHSAGFLGKFFADEIENAPQGPQEALVAVGASKLKVLRHAVLPEVMPQYVAYIQYILERNVRMATVIGLVGAGGIGIELKGRFDMFDFGHVSTILLTIFVTVFVLEQLSQRLRSRLIQG